MVDTVHRLPVEDASMVLAFTGHRGAGKTLAMTYYGVRALYNGYRVWSNYPITVQSDKGLLESIPLDINALRILSGEFAEGWVLIDELNLWLNSRRSMSINNLLFNQIFTMIRKRHLSLLYTTQNIEWVDKATRWQTDVHFLCQDGHFSEYGQEINLKRGELTILKARDLSGYITGTTYSESGREELINLEGSWLFPCFDTDWEFSLVDVNAKVRMNFGTIDYGKMEQEDNSEQGRVNKLLQDLRDHGLSTLGSQELINQARQIGILGDERSIGTKLKKAGALKKVPGHGKENYYEF